MSIELHFPRAYEFQRLQGLIKQHPEDFVVVERLPEQPSGEGEHLWLLVEKTAQNTQWVAKQLALWAGVSPREVSFAGMKDRQAVTTQTFSVHLPGRADPDMASFEVDGVRILSATRHTRKLKTGQLVGNLFSIRVRLKQHDDMGAIVEQWQQVVERGVPNYFGPQRFGQQGKNVAEGILWLRGEKKLPRHLQGIHLSAVRSWLFNQLLAQRVNEGNWFSVLPGDFVQFTEGKAGFYCEQPGPNDIERVEQGAASPCASLPGQTRDSFLILEEREARVLASYTAVLESLVNYRVDRHFRKLRLFIEQPQLQFIENDPLYTFFLPAGSFATSVMAELFDLTVQTGFADWNE